MGVTKTKLIKAPLFFIGDTFDRHFHFFTSRKLKTTCMIIVSILKEICFDLHRHLKNFMVQAMSTYVLPQG